MYLSVQFLMGKHLEGGSVRIGMKINGCKNFPVIINRENSIYVNYLENNLLNESLKVAVYVKININRIYAVF